MKKLSFFIAALVSCISYANAHENKYVFIGQNGTEMAFVLDIISEDMENFVSIGENGEVWLKADKIVAIPKDQFAQYINQDNSNSEIKTAVPLSFLQFQNEMSSLKNERTEEQEVKCPKCRFYYVPRPPTYNCPRCGDD